MVRGMNGIVAFMAERHKEFIHRMKVFFTTNVITLMMNCASIAATIITPVVVLNQHHKPHEVPVGRAKEGFFEYRVEQARVMPVVIFVELLFQNLEFDCQCITPRKRMPNIAGGFYLLGVPETHGVQKRAVV